MDQNVPPEVSSCNVKSAFDVVAAVTNDKASPYGAIGSIDGLGKFGRFLASKAKAVFSVVAILVFGFILSAGLAYFTKSGILANTAIGLWAAIVSTWLLYVLAMGFAGVSFAFKLLKAPYQPLLNAVQRAIAMDRPYIDQLAALDVNAVKYVLAYYRNERQAMERRGATLSGAIDRLGLFPAIGAVAFLYYGLLNLTKGNELGLMLSQILVSVIVAFHLLNFVVMPMYQKMDRIIAMLEYSVDTRI